MSLNRKEIDAALDELSLTGSFIQGVVQPSFDSIALFLYKGAHEDAGAKTVLIHLAPGVCRIHETKQKIPKTQKPLRFMEFLKSRVKGTKIVECAQIAGQRIIKIVCARRAADSPGAGNDLINIFVRLWSNAANIIVTDNKGTILDTFYRRPKKGEVTGGIFLAPNEMTTHADNAAQQQEYVVRDFSALKDEAQKRGIDFASLSFNQKIDFWYGEYAETLSRAAILESAQKHYTAQRSKMQNALARLESKRADFLHAEQWKHQGDLILAFAHLIDGSSFLECIDYDTGQPACIKISPNKSAQENAALYYTQYKKAMSGLQELEHDISRAKKELLDLDALYSAVFREENPIRMRQLIQKQIQPKQHTAKKRPGLTYDIHGWTIFAGRNAAENDELLRRHARGQDMWLHTRDWAGGYVFIKSKQGKSVPLDILLFAGNLALHHSKARAQGEADVYYTHVKYLRRAKNAPKGTVLPAQEKNIFIKRDSEKLKQLEEFIIE